jgi:DNA-binding MurR/RpiR family transcriptional regulator
MVCHQYQQLNLIMTEINIDKSELERVYREKTNTEAAKHFNISPTTLTKLLKQLGISGKGRGGRKRIRIIG